MRHKENAVRRGCETEGVLPGCIGLRRKAPILVPARASRTTAPTAS
jgi:L-serine dehydratase